MYGFDDELDYDLFPAFESDEFVDVEADSVSDAPSAKDKIKAGLSTAGETIKKIVTTVWGKIKEFGAWLMNMARAIKDHLAEIFKKDVNNKDGKDDEKMMSSLVQVQGLVLEMGDLAVDALVDITSDMTAETLSDESKNEAFKKFGQAMSNKTEITTILGKLPHFNASYKVCRKAHEGITKLYGTNSNIGRVWSKLNSIRDNVSGDRVKLINQFTRIYNALVNCSYALYNKVSSGFKKLQPGAANAYAEADKISKKEYKNSSAEEIRAKIAAGKLKANAKNGEAYAKSVGAEVGSEAEVKTVMSSPMFKMAADKKGAAILKSMASYAEKNNLTVNELKSAWKNYVRTLHNELMEPGSKISEKAGKIAAEKNKPAAVIFATNAILSHANRAGFIKSLNEILADKAANAEADAAATPEE